jgi:hypothetical protein
MQAEEQPLDGHHARVSTVVVGGTDFGPRTGRTLTELSDPPQRPVPAAGSVRGSGISETATREDATVNFMIEGALAIATRGFRVFPVRAPKGGFCPCRDQGCTKPGKHPHITKFNQRATTDANQVVEWWTKWPDANIGVVCGDGLVVVDIDGDEGEKWIAERDLPATLTATSGRGRHLYYAGDASGKIAFGPDVDVLGKGRYVVAPPSLHASGERYAWDNDLLTTPVAKAPAWVYEHVASASNASQRARKRQPRDVSAADDTVYAEGQRNEAMFRRASAMRRGSGMDSDEIRAALAVTNNKHCRPPLDKTELHGIADSAATNPRQFPDYATLRDLALLPTELAPLVTLLAEANAMGECTISYDVLAAKAGVSMSTAQRAVIELRRREIIDWSNRPFRSNRYTIKDCFSWKSEEQPNTTQE